ncbi:MAG: alpha/beta fold hydrolase [Dehalococcoidia bacterium]
MTAVFVHGVPDTKHLWDDVLSHLSREDTVAVSLPGFGVDAPDGFGSTMREYADWLAGEIEKIGEPVDLVGHDWGALLTERVVSQRPELIRTWAAGGGVIDEGYEWHPAAKMWQTPGMGEQFMEGLTADAMVAALTGEGVPEARAREFSERIDERMKAAILPLYRSAVNIGAEWGPAMDGVSRPGLVMWGEKDPYMSPEFHRKLAVRTKAQTLEHKGCSHWWPVQRPKETAEALEAFWGEQG